MFQASVLKTIAKVLAENEQLKKENAKSKSIADDFKKRTDETRERIKIVDDKNKFLKTHNYKMMVEKGYFEE